MQALNFVNELKKRNCSTPLIFILSLKNFVDVSKNFSRDLVSCSIFFTVSPSMLASLANFDDAEYDPKTRSKRGILPKQATRVMKTWLFQHLVVS